MSVVAKKSRKRKAGVTVTKSLGMKSSHADDVALSRAHALLNELRPGMDKLHDRVEKLRARFG